MKIGAQFEKKNKKKKTDSPTFLNHALYIRNSPSFSISLDKNPAYLLTEDFSGAWCKQVAFAVDDIKKRLSLVLYFTSKSIIGQLPNLAKYSASKWSTNFLTQTEQVGGTAELTARAVCQR